MRQIVLDTETTGLDPASHRIIEIGCVELINHVPTGRHFQRYLNPERASDARAFEVHGLSDEFLKGQPLFRADLFTRDSGAPGNWESAHYHPHFVEDWFPCTRVWEPALTADPVSWMRQKLTDVPGLLSAGGATELAKTVDQAEVDKALPAMMAAVETCMRA